jgi:hypothetical protein
MSRLRRLNGHSCLFPVAAEVLEFRALLSATVHAAVAHAQHALHPATPSAAAIHFAGPIVSEIAVLELAGFGFELDGKLSKGSVILGAGQAFSSSFNVKVPAKVPVPVISVSGKFTGTVNSFAVVANKIVVDITPSGTINATARIDGQRFKIQLAPKAGAPMTLKLNADNTFSSLRATYVLPNSGPFHGGDVQIVLTAGGS